MKVYVDVLVCVNLIVNYFLLLTVAKFLLLPAKRRRILLGAAVGALFSLTALLPEFPSILGFLMKLAISALVVFAAFGAKRGWKVFLKSLASFYIITFAFAGLMLAFWYFIAPQSLLIRNSVVYFDVSPLLLIALTLVCYFFIRLIQRYTGRQAPKELTCRVVVERNGRKAELTARVDTGNSLKEPFSGLPVLVVEEKSVLALAPSKESMRIVPYATASGSGLLPAFRPDRLTVILKEGSTEVGGAYVAMCGEPLSNGEFAALLNPDLLP